VSRATDGHLPQFDLSYEVGLPGNVRRIGFVVKPGHISASPQSLNQLALYMRDAYLRRGALFGADGIVFVEALPSNDPFPRVMVSPVYPQAGPVLVTFLKRALSDTSDEIEGSWTVVDGVPAARTLAEWKDPATWVNKPCDLNPSVASTITSRLAERPAHTSTPRNAHEIFLVMAATTEAVARRFKAGVIPPDWNEERLWLQRVGPTGEPCPSPADVVPYDDPEGQYVDYDDYLHRLHASAAIAEDTAGFVAAWVFDDSEAIHIDRMDPAEVLDLQCEAGLAVAAIHSAQQRRLGSQSSNVAVVTSSPSSHHRSTPSSADGFGPRDSDFIGRPPERMRHDVSSAQSENEFGRHTIHGQLVHAENQIPDDAEEPSGTNGRQP